MQKSQLQVQRLVATGTQHAVKTACRAPTASKTIEHFIMLFLIAVTTSNVMEFNAVSMNLTELSVTNVAFL